MVDKSWMLNPQAIRYAKACIEVVRKELNVKLKLSDPNFLQTLHNYVDNEGSQELNKAYSLLLSMAGPGTILSSLQTRGQDEVVVMPVQKQANGELFSDTELVKISGKLYPKWRDGKELKGLYRGQPSYQ